MKSFWKKTIRTLLPLVCFVASAVAQGSYSLLSPDKRIELKIQTGDRVRYDVLFKGTTLLQNSTFSIDIDHHTLGLHPKVTSAKQSTYDAIVEPPVRQKFATVARTLQRIAACDGGQLRRGLSRLQRGGRVPAGNLAAGE